MKTGNFESIIPAEEADAVAQRIFSEANSDLHNSLYGHCTHTYVLAIMDIYRCSTIEYMRRPNSTHSLIEHAIHRMNPVIGCPLYNSLVDCIRLYQLDQII